MGKNVHNLTITHVENGYIVSSAFLDSPDDTPEGVETYVFEDEKGVHGFFSNFYNSKKKKRKKKRIATPEQKEISELKAKIKDLGGELPRGRVKVAKLRDILFELEGDSDPVEEEVETEAVEEEDEEVIEEEDDEE